MAINGSITLPPEIIAEILRRLPSKSLGRFKCVSKDWLTLISNPQFIKTHQKTLNRNHLIFVSYDFSIYSLPFSYHESPAVVSSTPTKLRLDGADTFTFHGSSNGLMLLTAHHAVRADSLVVLNPTTREFLELPCSTHDLYGFGYDSRTDDYKVFTISYIPEKCLVSVQVYSLRTKTSNLVIMIDSYYLPNKRCLQGVFVNGFLHWIANKKRDEYNHDLPVILAFSLADEKLSEVPSPEWLSALDCKHDAVGDKLAVFLEDEGEVWLMNDYGIRESWTRILAHELDGNINLVVEPRILYDNGKILLESNDQMLIYDVGKSSFCGSIDFAANLDHLNVMCICSESLVSPNFS